MTEHIQEALRHLSTTISEIGAISGAPGLSYGVLHNGQLLYTENFGYSDVDARTPTTSDTQYYIGSLTKAFTAAAMGFLVDQGNISWDAPIQDILGGNIHFSEATLTQQMTVLSPNGSAEIEPALVRQRQHAFTQ
jgi:CubicO group peptidase (beta-lactamase class C family)